MADKDRTGEDHPEGNGPTDVPESSPSSESENSLDKQADRMHEKNSDK